MKSNTFLTKSHAAIFGLALLAAGTLSGHAQIVMTHNSAAPTPGLSDITNITTNTFVDQYCYSDNHLNHGVQYGYGTGESFLTGASAMTLNSISLKGANDGTTNSGTLWTISIYQVGEGNALTALTVATDLLDSTPPWNHPEPADWVTFSFTGANAITLLANTEYAFQITNTDSGSYFGFSATNDPAPANSAAMSFNGAAGMATVGTDVTSRSLVSNIGLTAVPEPSTYVLLAFGFASMSWLPGVALKLKRKQ